MKVIAAVLVLGALLLVAGPAKRAYDWISATRARGSTPKARASRGHWSTTAGAR